MLVGVSLLARLGLAAVWLVSGALKAADPLQTEVAVAAYRLLPGAAVAPVALVLPLAELALGLLLLAGIGVRAGAAVSLGVLAVFVAAVAASWARGLQIDCGCFGGGGPADVGPGDYLAEIARDVGFAALAGWLLVRPRTPAALGARSRADLAPWSRRRVAGPTSPHEPGDLHDRTAHPADPPGART